VSFAKGVAHGLSGSRVSLPHDLRHTAVRNFVRRGVPERVAMHLTGHKTRSVFERYNIVSDGDLREAARRLDEPAPRTTARRGQRSSQNHSVPVTLYKYLTHQYAEAFVQRGEVLFRSILYFLACEDARRDELEGTHQYARVGGIEVTNHTLGFTRVPPGFSMRSTVKHPDQVFVFCASHALKPELAEKFSSDACVEIADAAKLAARVKTAVRKNPRVKMPTFRAGTVSYYDTAQPPNPTWALPDEIIRNKRRQLFGDEEEYRLAFSLRKTLTVCARCREFRINSQSRHSDRTVRTNRPAIPFASGA
jgi:hypothetical protein